MSDFPAKLEAAHPVLKEARIVIGILQNAAIELARESDDDLAVRVQWCSNHIGALIDSYIERN